MTRDVLLGLDLGTSGVKALLLPVNGSPDALPSATVSYPFATPHPGWSEQVPDHWWRGVGEVVRTVLAQSGVSADQIAGVATSGQMHGATLLDDQGAVLRPCILWNDQRSAPQCDQITQQIGLDTLVRWVANPALAGFTAPKLLWVRRHEPDIWSRTVRVLLPKDYVNFRLTDEQATEPSDASGTLLFDVANRRWSDDMLSALELSPSLMPPVIPSTGTVGRVTARAARHTGLLEGTPVLAGGADNACAAVGAGVTSPGTVLTSLGTSGTVIAPTAQPLLDAQARLHMFCHAVPDTWYLMGVVLSAGGSLRWLRDTLRAAGQTLSYDALMQEAAGVAPGSEGLIFLPYLTGERTPHGDADARGVFFGLSLRHQRAHLVRSVVEGITYAMRDSLSIMRDLGITTDRVRTTGGGAKSAFWRQIQADVLNSVVAPVLSDAGPALGAAVIAGVGVGAFPDVAAAASALAPTGAVATPDAGTVTQYNAYAAIYDSLYPALADRFAALAAVVQAPA